MDFSTAVAAPFVIRINGTPYSLQRFLLPQMKQWAAEREKKIMDEAVSHYKNDDDKARFKTYFQVPPIDIFDIAKWARSPDGAEIVVDRQMKQAGVPDDVRAAMIANADPVMIGSLADKLCSAAQAAASAAAMTESGADPLAGRSEGSQDSPGIGQTNLPSSETSTPAQTPTD